MRGPALYDRIGIGCTTTRAEEPRIAGAIGEALAGACTVLNVGAGTGSYGSCAASRGTAWCSSTPIPPRPAPSGAKTGRAPGAGGAGGISVFARLDPRHVERALARLHRDLENGALEAQHADLLDLDALDLG